MKNDRPLLGVSSADEILQKLKDCQNPVSLSSLKTIAISKLKDERDKLIEEVNRLEKERVRLHNACSRMNEEISQELGKVLGYPWYKDDPKNFPECTEADGVCVGDEVAESLAVGASNRIRTLEAELRNCKSFLENMHILDVDWTIAESQVRHWAVLKLLSSGEIQ